MNAVPFRVRIKFSKQNTLRFIGHLDLQRLFERALTRTRLPLRYSQGFSPKIRINIASALPLGFISNSEYLDFWLNETIDLEEVKIKLQNALPKDIGILSIESVPNDLPSLQASVLSSIYEISIPLSYAQYDVNDKLNRLISQDVLMVERRKKWYDIKPLIEEYQFTTKPQNLVLTLKMKTSAESNGRPDEVLNLLGIDPADVIVERTKILLKE